VYVAAPLFDDRFPGDARGHLLEDIPHQDSRPPERWLTVADCGIGYDESSDHSLDRWPVWFSHDASATIIDPNRGSLCTVKTGTPIHPDLKRASLTFGI
jgi:hypothetical protein